MNKQHIFYFTLFFIVYGNASIPLHESDKEVDGRKAPIVTYELLKQGNALSRQYSECQIDGISWHCHWHMGDLDVSKTFPIDKYSFRVQLHTGLEKSITGTFAIYDLIVMEKETARPFFVPIPFYLSVPDGCRIAHNPPAFHIDFDAHNADAA